VQFLAAKQKEAHESTERALEPEFIRLRVANESEMADLEFRLAAEEKQTLVMIEKQFEEKVQIEEKAFRENQRNLARVQLEETMREVEKMEREHKMRLEHLTEDLARECEKYKQSLSMKVPFLFPPLFFLSLVIAHPSSSSEGEERGRSAGARPSRPRGEESREAERVESSPC
jgi:hypothetical protein